LKTTDEYRNTDRYFGIFMDTDTDTDIGIFGNSDIYDQQIPQRLELSLGKFLKITKRTTKLYIQTSKCSNLNF
jgi:hypothetical protein